MKDEEILRNVREHQRECVEFIKEYLLDSEDKKSALVKMPTGSGKSGIIALVIKFLMLKKKTCIVAPNEGLLKQLRDEISKKFWENIGVGFELESEIGILKNKELIQSEYNKFDVIITTVQSLAKMYSNKESNNFYDFKEYIDLVIFDEAHKEPAKSWAKAVRALDKKTLLFTATPFRNDNRDFIISEKYSYEVSTKECVGKYLKQVEFHKIDTRYDLLLRKVHDLVKQIQDDEMIVIHMTDYTEIEKMVIKLNEYSEGVALGFHSRFKNKNSCYDKYSFGKINTTTRIIIHQNMLKEGVNIPEISTVIFADDIKNIRDVVQQIGRALRKNSDNKKKSNAYIYTSENVFEHYKAQWKMFLDYDCVKGYRVISKLVSESEETFMEEIVYDELKKMFVACLSPRIEERNEIDFNIFDEVSLKKAANVFLMNDKYLDSDSDKRFAEIVDEVIAGYKKNKKITILRSEIDQEKKIHISIYKKSSYSDIFKKTAFKEDTFEYFLIAEVDDYLFFNDSSGFALNIEIIKKYFEEVSVEQFIQLIPKDTLGIELVKLKSASFSRAGIYNREFQGRNIEKTSTNIIERNTVCNRLQLKLNDDNRTSRYIGVSNNRISDNDNVDCNDYLNWCKEIIYLFKFDKNHHKYIDQFALPIKYDPSLIPTSILIDLQNINDMNLKMENEDELEEVKLYESISAELDESYCFKYYINDVEYEGRLLIDNTLKKPKWNVNSKILKEINDSNNKSLEKIINSEQRVRLMFKNSDTIYMDGNYFKPNIDFNMFKDIESLDIDFEVVKGLENCTNEKYGNCKTSSMNFQWPQDSVFGVFMDKHEKDFDYIMCDDMNDEIADFVLVNLSEKKIVFAHCKHGKSISSGAAFQDVCGQAVKNLTYVNKLSARNIDGEYKIESWDKPWKLTPRRENRSKGINEIKFETKRLRKAPSSADKAQEFWDAFKRVMNLSDVSVEVWLYTSGLSLKKFEDNIMNKKTEHVNAYTKQLIWILLSTKDSIGQVGATLKIFCKE